MKGRNYTSESGYRYGFNGKEKDDEGMGGGGQTYDYGFRIYNPSLAKFLSVDPLSASYPWYTPYQFAGNKPIFAIDLDGLEELQATLDDWHKHSPLIDMDYAPNGSTLTGEGFKRNGPWYWRQLRDLHPEYFNPENQILIAQGLSPEVNDQWLKYFPEHAKYKGDKLVHHHWDQKNMAGGIPQRAHRENFSALHKNLGGTKSFKNPTKNLGLCLTIIGGILDISGYFTGNPDNFWINTTAPVVGQLQILPAEGYPSGPITVTSGYIECTKITDEYDTDGNLKCKTVNYMIWGDYIWDEEQNKYIGVDMIKSGTRYINYKDGKCTGEIEGT